MKNLATIAIVFTAILITLIATRMAFYAMKAPLADLGVSPDLIGTVSLLILTSVGTVFALREHKLRVKS